MTVRDIVVEYLRANGWDGLFNEEIECGCLTNDLAPCWRIRHECEAGCMTRSGEIGSENWTVGRRAPEADK